MNLRDANLIKTKALPAAGASAYCDAIDLGAQSGSQKFVADIEFEVSIPATASLAAGKTIVVDIQTCEESTFASPTLAIGNLLTVTGGSGGGGAAASAKFRLPTDVKRYVRTKATVESAGGDNTAVSSTLTGRC
ncbi:MAG TPA: hypothetical protein PKG77_22985 [Phycisphaerae bacterium]|nr:hypothetical protein [Phycisphaerae bacterium]